MLMDSRIFQKLQGFPTWERRRGSMKISWEPSLIQLHCTCWRYRELRTPLGWRECALGRCNTAYSRCWEQYSKMLQRSLASTSSVREQDFRCWGSKVQWGEFCNGKNRMYHLSKTCNGEILSDVVVGEVTKTSHPDISSNEDTDCVVYLSRSKVVIH